MAIPLGQHSKYSDKVDPSLLARLARGRAAYLSKYSLGEGSIFGFDDWHAYELSWLSRGGIPRVGVVWLRFPVQSDYLIESKSLKLYLNGFFNTKFASKEDVEQRILSNLSEVLETRPLNVVVFEPKDWESLAFVSADSRHEVIEEPFLMADQTIAASDHITTSPTKGKVEEYLSSNLLRGVCPVTSQPDWGSVDIHYRGVRLDRASIIGWLIEKRSMSGFHEQLADELYAALYSACQPEFLSIQCFFLRRGGIDITPCRHSAGYPAPKISGRKIRQ